MKHYTILVILLCLHISSCSNPPAFMEIQKTPDLIPPQLQDFQVKNQGIFLSFDEKPIFDSNNIRISPKLTISDISIDDHQLEISLDNQIPGIEYQLLLVVADSKGNSQNLMLSFYGFNPKLPNLIINEFTTQGSSKHPDLVEILILEPGNIGGLCFYEGTKNNWKQRFIFPSVELNKGDFLILHTKPQGIAQEINEIQSPEQSEGLDVSDEAYDFWLNQGKGLGGNNGVLTLYSSPSGQLIDGVLYSNRRSQSDTKYKGFGSRRLLEQAKELVDCDGWNTKDGEIRPEDAINPDKSTATRSMGRIPGQSDMNVKTDWIIVDTREASFGYKNSIKAYKPSN